MPLASKPRLSFQLLALRSLTVVVGCLGFLWGVSNIARGEGSDVFWDIEARLLRFEVFSRASSIAVLESAAGQDLNPCDNHAQRALMLIEIPLADAALRSGAVQEFDQRIRSLETRARQTLGCTPRDSFVWLLLRCWQFRHWRRMNSLCSMFVIRWLRETNGASCTKCRMSGRRIMRRGGDRAGITISGPGTNYYAIQPTSQPCKLF